MTSMKLIEEEIESTTVSEQPSSSGAAGGGDPLQQDVSLFDVAWPGVVSALRHARGFGFITLDDDDVIRRHEQEHPDAYLDGKEHKYEKRRFTCVSRGSHERRNCDCLR